MVKRNLKPGKVGWLILVFFLVPLFMASNSVAIPLNTELTNPVISYSTLVNLTLDGSHYYNYYTDYAFDSDQTGYLDAFCVENANVVATGATYAITTIPGELNSAANIANAYWNGSLSNKSAAQIAIWDVVFDNGDGVDYGNVRITGALHDDVQKIIDGSYSGPYEDIYLAVSPWDGGYSSGPSQDYLVSVPDASMMFLLGPAMIGMAIFTRKRKSYK